MAFAPGFATSLLLEAAKAANRVRTALANRRAAKELLDWDSRSLSDIGLTRSDVRGALALPLSTDPTHSLSLIAAGRDIRPRRDGAGRPLPSGTPAASKARLGTLPSAEPVPCT